MRFAVLLLTLLALAVPALAHAQPAPVAWCGTDEATQNRVPDLEVSAAQQIRLVYAVPSDAPDRFAATASGMATDAAWIDAWWQAQDPTRTPRFDRYAFPGCSSRFGQLDIGFVRLPNPAVYYAVPQTPSLRLDRDLRALDVFPDNQKTIVYFDSPIRDSQVCGETDYLSDTQGGAQGIVYIYLQSGCNVGTAGGGGTAEVAAHELLHNLGAVPDAAPHECPSSPSHACDSTTDIMYPYINDGSTLDTVQLDVGNDDYYAHTSSWWDVQDSGWLAHLPQFSLSLAVAGNGKLVAHTGGVQLSCDTGCSNVNLDSGAAVSVTAVPAAGYAFSSWSGACRGTARSCTVAVGAEMQATATFVKATALRLTVAVSGKGRVTSSPPGVACSRSCTTTLAAATARLTAKPASGWRFRGWSGACSGKGVCTVARPGTARARFTR